MPGIGGLVGVRTVAQYGSHLPAMLDALSYGNCRATKIYTGQSIAMGCTSLGKPGQRIPGVRYEGDAAVVLVHGYIVPRTDTQEGETLDWDPARQVYDQYVRLGPACIEQLDGTFSIAIWDKACQRLVLGTDRFGLQTLYYIEQGDGLLFASEPKGVLQVPSVARELNQEAVADFFSFGYIHGDKTFVQGVQLLPPASTIIYQDGRWSQDRYWHLPYPDSYPSRPDEWYDELVYDAIAGAIDGMLEPDRQYGIPLSGGLDGRWVAALLIQRRPDTVAMTFGLEGCDDVRLAIRIARQIGIEHVWIPLTADVVIEQIDKVVYITDGMFSVFHANEFPLSLAQPNYADISVGGYLGGELFGSRVNPQSILLTRRSSVLPYLYKKLRRSTLPDKDLARVFGDKYYAELKQIALQSVQDGLAEVQSAIPVNMVEGFEFRQRQRRRGFLGQLLKQAYIAARYPLSHRQVVKAALQLPPTQRLGKRAYRRSFVKHFPSLGAIPWEATLRPPSSPLNVISYVLQKTLEHLPSAWLPYQIAGLHIRRRAYADYATWMQGRLGQYVKSVLFGPDSDPWRLFNSAYLSELVEAQVTGRRNISEFISLLLSFELWSRMFLGLAPIPDSLMPPAPSHQRMHIRGGGVIL